MLPQIETTNSSPNNSTQIPTSTLTSSNASTPTDTPTPSNTPATIVTPAPFTSYEDVINGCITYADKLIADMTNPNNYNVFNIPAAENAHDIVTGLRTLGNYYSDEHPGEPINPGELIKKHVGYAIKDLNGDGINEMILLSDNYFVIGVFTLVDNKPFLLDGFCNRYTCDITGSGLLYIHSSSGAGDGYDKKCQILPNGKEITEIERYGVSTHISYIVENFVGKQFQYYKVVNGKAEIISEKEFIDFSNNNELFFTENSSLKFIPLLGN